MRYSFISAALLALTSSVFAQTDGYNAIVIPVKNQKVPAGKPFDIVWQPGKFKTGTATIILLQGASESTLQLGQTIIAGVSNTAGKYTWEVPASVPSFAVYGFKITHDDDKATAEDETKIFQYSFPFQITGNSGSTASSSAGGNYGGTTTVKISAGPSYTPEPTPTPSPNSTVATHTISRNSTVVVPTVKPTSNYTLTTVGTTVRATPTGGAPSSATTPVEQTANAAVANAFTGGLAVIGGVVLAFAL